MPPSKRRIKQTIQNTTTINEVIKEFIPHIETWDESRAMQATTQACMELLRKAERRVKNSSGTKRSRDHKSGITHQESEHHTTEKTPQV